MTSIEFYENEIEAISYKKSCLNGIKGVEDACNEPIYSKDELIAFAEAYYKTKMKHIMPSDEVIEKPFNNQMLDEKYVKGFFEGAKWLKQQIKNYGMHYCKVFGKWQYSCDHYECNN